jgi:hypothetical protein
VSFTDSAIDVVSYQCAVDGGAFAPCASPQPVTPGSDGVHTEQVRAVDHATNVGPASSVSWLQDTTTPQPVLYLTPPTVTSSTSAAFGFSSTESGVTFSCSVDGGGFSACTDGQVFTGFASGAHSFKVRATDSVGNTADSAAFGWTVSATPVVLGWTGALPGPVSNQNHLVAVGYSVSGETTLACTLDGVALGSCASPVTLPDLADGVHTFAVVANPGTANEVQLQHSWTVDTVPPSAPLVTGPSGHVASTSANVSVTPATNGDIVSCTLDGAASTCGPSLTALSQGLHTFAATSADAAGNQSSAANVSWTVDTVPPVAVVSAPTQIDQPAKVSFGEAVTGAAAGVSLKLSTGAVVATKATLPSTSSVWLTPVAPLVPGESYQVVVASTVADLAGNPAAATAKAFRATTAQQETSRAAAYSWRNVATSQAKGGSYRVEHRAGATASFRFTGTAVTWYTVTGRAFGLANVYVDGVRKLVVNNYSSTTHYGVARTVSHLSNAVHTLRISVVGHKGAAAGTDTQVAVDAFKVGAVLTVTPSLAMTWRHAGSVVAWGAAYSAGDLAGDRVVMTFRGTAVTWYTLRARSMGVAAVYIDGHLRATLDQFVTSTTMSRIGRNFGGLTNARHTIVIVVLGRHHAGGTGNTVAIDGWLVH